jgi:prophage maintenance system killer protein
VTALDVADLVVIGGRTLGISTDAALALMDIAAARDALAEAMPPGQQRGADFADRAAAAAAGARLVHALLSHRPFPRQSQQLAVTAGLQFLSLNGWSADLNPAATAAVVVEALAAGRLAPEDAAAWLSPRLSPARRAGRDPAGMPRPRIERPRIERPRIERSAPRPSFRVPVGQAVAAALLAVAVAGFTLLAGGCSRGPDLPATPTATGTAVRHSPGPKQARPDLPSASRPAPGIQTPAASAVRSTDRPGVPG